MAYSFVHLGPLDAINGAGKYAFPTIEAATFFALNHKRRDPHRTIHVETPDGITETHYDGGTFYKRDFAKEAGIREKITLDLTDLTD